MNWMIALLIAVHPRSSASDHLYREMEELGGACFPRDSCGPARTEDNDHLWGNYTCECGAHCVRYGTCCANSPHAGVVLTVEQRGEVCQKLSTAFARPVIAVSGCSYRWRGGRHVRERCERPLDVAQDPMSAVHVTSLETQVTYKNYFCAMCNHDSRDVRLWDVELRFDVKESVPDLLNVTREYLLENLYYDEGSRTWGVASDGGAFYKVKFRFEIPDNIRKHVKKCYPGMVDRCRGSTFDNHLQYKCASYYAPIRVQTSGRVGPTKFRNVHCALCNGVNLTRSDSNACRLDVESRRTFSLAHLLDVNRSDGELVGKREICGRAEKWDPFFKKCRSLVCALPGYVVREGKCVPS